MSTPIPGATVQSVTLEHLDAALKLASRCSVPIDLALDEIWASQLTGVDRMLFSPRELSRFDIEELGRFVSLTAVVEDHQPEALHEASWPRLPLGLWDRLVKALYATTIELPSKSTGIHSPDWRLSSELQVIVDFCFRYGTGDAEQIEESQDFLHRYETAYRLFERDEEQSAEPLSDPVSRANAHNLPFDLGARVHGPLIAPHASTSRACSRQR